VIDTKKILKVTINTYKL